MQKCVMHIFVLEFALFLEGLPLDKRCIHEIMKTQPKFFNQTTSNVSTTMLDRIFYLLIRADQVTLFGRGKRPLIQSQDNHKTSRICLFLCLLCTGLPRDWRD